MNVNIPLLVGNGTKLLDSKWGTYIDKHVTVVRFNGYKTKGFEENVGSKTDIYICNKYFQSRFEHFKGEKYIYNPFNKPLNKCNQKYIISNLFLLHHKKKHKYSEKQIFSLGMATILYFLFKKKINTICIANFNFNTNHYFEGKYTGPIQHNFYQEKNIVHNLVDEGRIIMFEDLFL